MKTRTILLLLAWIAPAWSADSAIEAASWNNRAGELFDQERYLEAEAGYRQVIRLVETAAGPEAAQLAQPLNNLAIVYRRLGRLRDAEACYRRSLEIRPSTLVQVNLARLYQQMRRYGKAGSLLHQAIAEAETDADVAALAAARHTHAALLLATGKLEASRREAGEAVRLWRSAHRPADAAKALGMLAETLRRSGLHREAASAFERALATARPALGSEHPEVGRMLQAYASTLAKLDRKREAKQLRRQAEEILAGAPARVAREHIVDASEWIEEE